MEPQVLIDLDNWKVINIISTKGTDNILTKSSYHLIHDCISFPANITTYTAKVFRKCINCSVPVPDDVFAIIHTLRLT